MLRLPVHISRQRHGDHRMPPHGKAARPAEGMQVRPRRCNTQRGSLCKNTPRIAELAQGTRRHLSRPDYRWQGNRHRHRTTRKIYGCERISQARRTRCALQYIIGKAYVAACAATAAGILLLLSRRVNKQTSKRVNK